MVCFGRNESEWIYERRKGEREERRGKRRRRELIKEFKSGGGREVRAGVSTNEEV